MPVVPFTQRQGQSQPLPKVDPTFLMMAAAELHEAGRLVEPTEVERAKGLEMLKGQMQAGIDIKGSPKSARDMTEADYISGKVPR